VPEPSSILLIGTGHYRVEQQGTDDDGPVGGISQGVAIPCRLFMFFVEGPIHYFHDVCQLIAYPKSSAWFEAATRGQIRDVLPRILEADIGAVESNGILVCFFEQRENFGPEDVTFLFCTVTKTVTATKKKASRLGLTFS
jgi:hypothetical protein